MKKLRPFTIRNISYLALLIFLPFAAVLAYGAAPQQDGRYALSEPILWGDLVRMVEPMTKTEKL